MSSQQHPTPAAGPTPTDLVRAARARVVEEDREGAVELLARAIGVDRSLPEAWSLLGEALEGLGRWREVLRAYEQAVHLRPEDAEAHKNLGRALVQVGRVEESVRRFRRASDLAPHSAECQELLGLVYQATERPADARKAYHRAIELDPGRASAHHHLGLLLAEGDQLTSALEQLEAAAQLEPEQATYHRELARVALRARDGGRARRAADEALRLAPEDAIAHVVKGSAHELAGAREASLEHYRRALELDPSQATPYYRLARAGAFDDLDAVERELERPGRTRAQLGELQFARAELLAASERFEDAWRAYAAGHAEVADEANHQPEAHRKLTERIVAATPAELFQERYGMGDPNRLPVFVVGMPRSGLSLVEQLLTSHPAVFGVGEHTGVESLARALGQHSEAQHGFPEGLADLDRTGAVRMAAEYLRSIEHPPGEPEGLVDRAPDSFHYLGLIALALPNARVVHVRRDPLDTCVSNFTTRPDRERSSFASDVDGLAGYYEDYQTLMAHWRAVLPLRMLEVDYEELVADHEGQARRLLEFLDLPWDDRCLALQDLDRGVVTASSLPVREPMHLRSVGRWRPYERWLGPLRRLRS